MEKAVKNLKQQAEKISLLLEKLSVLQLRMVKVTTYESQLVAAWSTYRSIHSNLAEELINEEEIKSLYLSTEQKFISASKIIMEFKDAAKAQGATWMQTSDDKENSEEGEGSESHVQISKTQATEELDRKENGNKIQISKTKIPQPKLTQDGDRKRRRFYNLLGELGVNLEQLEETLGSLSQSVIEVKKNRILRNFTDLKKIYDEMTADPSYDDIEDEFIEVQNEYDSMLEKMACKADELKNDNKTSSAKLEHIKIPHFSGNINDWPAFHDLFRQLVDSNKYSSNVEKLYRLKTNVHGEASKLIQHILITEENYEAAWAILKQRYENKRMLFSNLVDKLIDQPNVNTQSVTSIKQLLDTTTECLQALKAMGITLEDADPFIARILIRKLDRDGLVWYEQSVQKTKEIQKVEDVMKFLEQQYLAQQAVQNKKGNSTPYRAPIKYSSSFQTLDVNCWYCSTTGHKIEDCRKFLALTVIARSSWVKKEKLCEICIGHKTTKKCFKYNNRCTKCGKRHHSLLHYTEFEQRRPEQHQIPKSSNLVTRENSSVTLLATAQIQITSATGELVVLRALIDQGSQRTSISEEAAQILQLPRKRLKTELIGLGNTVVGVSKSTIDVAIRPRFQSDVVHCVNALVLKNLASAQPDKSFCHEVMNWENYCLADPNFNKTDRIDLIIGADLFSDIIQPGVVKRGKIVGQETTLGWILSGILNLPRSSAKVIVAVTRDIERFWEMEEITDSVTNDISNECEDYYKTTTTVDENNRLVVRLPFKDDRDLGNTRRMSVARLLSLEKKLKFNPKLASAYRTVMDDLLKEGHMVKVTQHNTGKCYMPHQAVTREDHSTTKVRVVFDASANSSNGRSFNDVVHTGPKLQYDIFDILIIWRLWKYVISADVEKMFRQIKVAEDDQSYQMVLWRSDFKKPIEEYKLTTVSYGTACAPFLAKRSLIEIGNKCEDENPELASIIKNHFYMDDLMTGADTKGKCTKIQVDVTNQLQKFGFVLRKWLSNEKSILSQIHDVSNNKIVQIKEGEAVKTLGVQWEPDDDNFTFYFKTSNNTILTKRYALSTLAKIFDPLGWLAPITTLAKLYIQKLWLMNLEWDEQLSDEMCKEWQKILQNITIVDSVKIPRWLNVTSNSEWELHGFADASGKAYAAVVYAKVGRTITLIAAKSKVNPIKNRKTLPKLELCAAHHLSKLLNKILLLIQRDVKVYTWSDSTITLSWIKNNEKSKDKFIRTRVKEINELIPTARWSHVPTKDNPADAASRGMVPEKLVKEKLWWNGPEWLKEDEAGWPQQVTQAAINALTKVNEEKNFLDDLVLNNSNYNKLIRIVSYVIRFIGKLKGKQYSTYLSTDEIKNAKYVLVQQVQMRLFPTEISCLKNKKEVPTKNKICSLNPFLDENGILRVGGRLANSSFSYNRKHPILLASCHFTDVLIKWFHNITLHGGGKVMAATISREFWIIGAKNNIKKCIRGCVRCQRYRKATMVQIMGQLPESRVAVAHPFTYTGVDYAGPIQMRVSRGRGQRSYKGYIAVFVCMTTKAVHLEAVSELSTDAFMAALRRFFARRGKSAHIYSDNGTNFVGASNVINKDYKEALKNNPTIAEQLASENVKWHFIPPGAPHFGGIWEAAVKSVKHHLRRVIGEAKLTYEEMATLLAQVEAVLNSRPLYELPNDAEDIDVLTPGHFLVGRPLLDLPDGGNINNVSSVNRWKLLQKMRRDFWKQWKEEYINTLQQRAKWKQSIPNVEKDRIVLVKEENTSPARWPLARVIDTHAGKDGNVRVVTLKLQQQVLKRPITKICPLDNKPNSEDIQQSTTHFTRTGRSVPNKASTVFFLMTMFLIGNVLGGSEKSKANIETFNENTAIYLDNLGIIEVSESNWNLVVYYDLHAYLSSLDQVVKLINQSKAVCSKIGEFEEQCKTTLTLLNDRSNVVKSSNQLFFLEQNHREKRSLDFIGSFYHLLFGLMDNDDREEMEHDMRNLLENESNMKDLIKNQTSTVDSSINLFRKSKDEIDAGFKVLQTRIENMTKILQQNMFIYKESIKFFGIARQIESQLEEVERTQQQIIRLLMDINHGKISPDLLKPEQLSSEVAKIKEWLPENTKLPGSKGNQLATILKTMKAKAIILEGKLVIKANIPLISSRSANVFKVVSVPVQQLSNVVTASISKPYLVYSYDSDVYHLMSDVEFHRCEENNDRQFLCEGSWAWQDANTNTCEMAPLKPHKEVNCHFIEIGNKNIWVKLSSKQKWLFKINSNTTLHVYCGQKQQELIKLPKQGVLTLGAGCSAQEGKTMLPANSETSRSIEGSFGTHLINEISYNSSQFIKPLGSIVFDHSSEIDTLKEEITRLKATDVHLKGLTFHHASGHTSLGLLTICIIVVIIYFTRKCILAKRAGMLIIRAPQNV